MFDNIFDKEDTVNNTNGDPVYSEKSLVRGRQAQI